MHFTIILGAAAALVVARIVYPIFSNIFSPLRTIPGPFAARFGDLWYLWRIKKGHFELENIQLHQKYGKPAKS